MSGDPRSETMLVVGCGSMGKRHARNLDRLGVESLVGVDPDLERRDTVRETLGIETAETLSDGLARNPYAVFVCAPNSHHLDIAQEAAQAGCHLFVEKPLSHTLNGVEDLLGTVNENDLTGMVGCNMRFHPCIRQMRDLVSRNVIGDVVTVDAQAGEYLPDWHPDEDYRTQYSANRSQGGGAILDYIHEINYVRWLMGDVDNVSCFMGTLGGLDIDTEDTAAILLRNGDTIGKITVDYLRRQYHRSCIVVGTSGHVRWEWDSRRVTWETVDESGEYELPDDWEVNDMYLDQLRHFIEVLRDDEAPTVDLRDGARDIAVAMGAKDSSNRGEHVSVASYDQ